MSKREQLLQINEELVTRFNGLGEGDEAEADSVLEQIAMTEMILLSMPSD